MSRFKFFCRSCINIISLGIFMLILYTFHVYRINSIEYDKYGFIKHINQGWLYREHSNDEIPSIIHQIWIGNMEPPNGYLKTWYNGYLTHYPWYKYMLWNETNIKMLFESNSNKLIKSHLYSIYKSEHRCAGKADIARLVILYEFGGIYVDADSVYLKNSINNFDKLMDVVYKHNKNKTNINNKYCGFAAKDPSFKVTPWIPANGVMGFYQNSECLLYLIKHLIRIDQTLGYKKLRKGNTFAEWELTGPRLLNLIRDNIKIYPQKYFYPIKWHGISDPCLHRKLTFDTDTFMFQYGINTNTLKFVDLCVSKNEILCLKIVFGIFLFCFIYFIGKETDIWNILYQKIEYYCCKSKSKQITNKIKIDIHNPIPNKTV